MLLRVIGILHTRKIIWRADCDLLDYVYNKSKINV